MNCIGHHIYLNYAATSPINTVLVSLIPKHGRFKVVAWKPVVVRTLPFVSASPSTESCPEGPQKNLLALFFYLHFLFVFLQRTSKKTRDGCLGGVLSPNTWVHFCKLIGQRIPANANDMSWQKCEACFNCFLSTMNWPVANPCEYAI